jgi:hypothetical protein
MEWRRLAKGLNRVYMNKMENTVPQILTFADSVLLLLTVIKREGIQEDDRALTCLDYCIRNLGLVLKVSYQLAWKGLCLASATSKGKKRPDLLAHLFHKLFSNKLPLWSCGQSSWLKIQKSRLDSWHYQIF